MIFLRLRMPVDVQLDEFLHRNRGLDRIVLRLRILGVGLQGRNYMIYKSLKSHGSVVERSQPKPRWLAANQKVGSSNLSGRAIRINALSPAGAASRNTKVRWMRPAQAAIITAL